jgi:hypothetical protein
MCKKDWILAGVEFVLWYAWIYIFLYTIKNPVNLYLVAGLLLVIMYAASISCPLVRHSKPWRRLFHKEY